MPCPDSENALRAKLLAWFTANKRPLPWRETYEPYAVWISEIMLQQTQMDRAVAYFTRWMERFPDTASLARASEEDVFKHWEGLGYYNRARNLHKAARLVTEERGGRFPDALDAVLALPGIGRYTAGAILSIAFNKPVPLVDANVARVFARLFDIDAPIRDPRVQTLLWDTAARLVQAAAPGQAREWNQALMELGALVCAKKPRCDACPVSAQCEALRLRIIPDRPVLGPAKDIIPLEVVSGVLVHQGRMYIQKRLPQGAWAGLWEFPGGRIEAAETPEQAVVREFAEETGFSVTVKDKLDVIRHGYTTYRVTLHCWLLALAGIPDGPREGGPPAPPILPAATDWRWAALSDLDRFAFPAGHRKLIDRLNRDLRFIGLLE